MQRRICSLLLLVIFAPLAGRANTTGGDYFLPELAAKAVAVRMNESASEPELLSILNTAMPLSEREGLERIFSNSQTFHPSNCRSQKNVVICGDGTSITFRQNRSVNFMGRVWNPPEPGKLDLFLEDFMKAKSAAIISRPGPVDFIFPSARANPALIALGLVTLSIMGCFADYVYAGVVYLGKDLYQFARDGEVFCEGDTFTIRGKIKDSKGFPAAKIEKIDAAVVSQLMKQNITSCTREIADKFALKLKTARLPQPGNRETSATIENKATTKK